MSAAPRADAVAVDRRAVLRAGLLLGATAAVATTVHPGASTHALTGLLPDPSSRRTALPTATAALPTAAAWEQLLGHEVALTGEGWSAVAQVVDVRDVAHPSPHVTLHGEAYSVLLDAPSLPAASSLVVGVHHEALGAPVLVVMPVNGDGSWEAIVDRRTPTTTS